MLVSPVQTRRATQCVVNYGRGLSSFFSLLPIRAQPLLSVLLAKVMLARACCVVSICGSRCVALISARFLYRINVGVECICRVLVGGRNFVCARRFCLRCLVLPSCKGFIIQ